ncbi:MAG: metabolite traffic protein EboE [Planctomycetes bacterium]|nr:metabolite traffic protein EboE [Planctomycetota bacterium]
MLTYCGNVHAAEDLDSWLDTTRRFAGPLAARRRAAGQPFGLGTWWNAATVALLHGDPAARDRVRSLLAAEGLSIWTLNVFPFGAFHRGPVKTAVYAPDWADESRLMYTRQAAEVLADLGSEQPCVPLSTLPLAFEPRDPRVLARNLARAASHLHAVEAASGLHMVLLLEPEPFCQLETVAQAIEFFETWLLREGAWTVPEERLRRHLGVCVDLCHLAVVGEDALDALDRLDAAGIRCAKIQVSACVEVRRPEGLDRLLEFDEPVYLHQTVAADGARALDLPEVAVRRTEFAAAGPLRTHFHVPVFWDDPGPLGSTRAELERVLRGLPGRSRAVPLLEVETYTWDVLPGFVRGEAALLDGIDAELRFVDAQLGGDSPASS